MGTTKSPRSTGTWEGLPEI